MEGFILKSEDETIAVIANNNRDSENLKQNIKLAIAEHYITPVETVDILKYRSVPDLYIAFAASNIADGDELEIRDYSLTKVSIYNTQ